MGDTMKHRAAVVAEGRRQVRENLPFVLLARLGTRNRGPGKPGPSFVVWSCVAEKSRRTVATCPIDAPKRGIQLREKNIKPILYFPFPLNPKTCFYYPFLFFFLRSFPQKLRQSEAEATRGKTCTWTTWWWTLRTRWRTRSRWTSLMRVCRTGATRLLLQSLIHYKYRHACGYDL